jgi:hypothetical protein
VQHCRILLPEKPHDGMITCCWDLVDLTVAVLKAASLGLKELEFRNAEATKAWYACRRQAIFLESTVENTMDVVVANERTVDPHEINIHDVVHEFEKLDLTMGKTTDADITKQPTGYRTSLA